MNVEGAKKHKKTIDGSQNKQLPSLNLDIIWGQGFSEFAILAHVATASAEWAGTA